MFLKEIYNYTVIPVSSLTNLSFSLKPVVKKTKR